MASGKQQSPWSATMIGVHPDPVSLTNSPKKLYKQEANEVSKYMEGVHHSRKISHQQVNYSETINRRSKQQVSKPLYLQKAEQVDKNATLNHRYKAFTEQMNKTTKSEQDFNFRRRVHNREMGRISEVDSIVVGRGSVGAKDPIFPQKATHNQILGMTGKLSAPSANTQPPAVKRTKKWLGDGLGWED